MNFKKTLWMVSIVVALAACGSDTSPADQTVDAGTDSSGVVADDSGTPDGSGPEVVFVESACTLVTEDRNEDDITDLRILYYGNMTTPQRIVTTANGVTRTVDQDSDEDGRLTFLRLDRDSDGVVDATLSYTYDARGELQHFGVNTDSDADYEYISATESTPSGQPLTSMADGVFNFDTGELVEAADGRPNYLHEWTYNAQNQFVRFTIKFDGNDTIQYEETRGYDADGKVLLIEKDGVINDTLGIYQRADGVINFRQTFRYDGAGNEVRSEIDGFHVFLPASYYTEDADGEADFISTNKTFDSNGNVISYLLAGRFAVDGQFSLKTPGFFDRYDLEWAKVGNAWLRTRLSLDEENNGTTDFVFVEEYDDGGRTTRLKQDGVIDQRGRILTRSDGQWNDVTDQTFTAGGNFLSWQRDMDGDSQADVETYWTWIDTPMGERRTLYEQDGSLPRTFEGYEYGVSGQADGIVDIRREDAYDEFGRTISVKSSEPGRPTYTRTLDYGECADLEAR